MKKTHEEYQSRVEFLFVYIREAHPSDSNWPDPELSLEDPRTDEDRRAAAKRCVAALNLRMTAVVDGLDDAVSMRYSAWPERIYVIDETGCIAFKGRIGPIGFDPQQARGVLDKLLAK